MCKRKRAEGLDKGSARQGPAKAGPATAQGRQPDHILYRKQQAQHSMFMGDHSKKYKASQGEEPVTLIVTSWCYSCHLHGVWDHKFLQNGRNVPRAGRAKCCSKISSANLLTAEPPRAKSTPVPGPSLATLWSFGLMAIRHLCTPWSFIALERPLSAFPNPVPGKQVKMQVQQETRKLILHAHLFRLFTALWQT